MSQLFKAYTKPDQPGAFSGVSGFKRNNKRFKAVAKKLS